MTGLALALLAGYGAFLLYTWAVFGWSGLGMGPGLGHRRAWRPSVAQVLARSGLDRVRPAELAAVTLALAILGAGLGYVLFGGAVAALLAGLFAAGLPVTAARARRARELAEAREAWPRMIEEIRLQTASLGRSVPHALLTVGLRGPEPMRPAFAAAQREWLLSTDFSRTLVVLKHRLGDPTADAVCETLLVAHEVGGADLDRRLKALIMDRTADVAGRKDALSKQAGARFARRFVLVVPIGMALAGLSIGDGRAAYATPLGQAAVGVGIALQLACWVWAGRIMRLPDQERVFAE